MSFNISNEAFDRAFKDKDFNNNKKKDKKNKESEKRWDKKKEKYILKKQIYRRLTDMLEEGKGKSRREDKKSKEDLTKNRIYSFKTYHTYKEQCMRFANFLKEKHPEILKIQKVKVEHVNEYLQSMIDEGLSAYSISTAKAAIAKVMKRSSTNFIATPSRHRRAIKRSRYEAVRDKHISEETESKFAKITSATGLRRSELEKVRGVDLKFYHGKYYVKVRQGKGGKQRFALICGKDEKETKEVVELFKESGQLKVVPKLPSHYDNHSYRATYAKRIYNLYARPIEKIPTGSIDEGGKRYVMRGDRAGEILDRDAMEIASRFLGHNRIDVIALNYLY